MDKNEIKGAFAEAMQEMNAAQNHAAKRKVRRKGMEFSKWLLIIVGIPCAGTWIVAAVSWILWREFPLELVEYTRWFFGAIIAYMLKSGYENRPKIQKGKEAHE